MRHLVDGRQFGRDSSHRKAMFKALANNLIEHEQVKTTLIKAKELRRVVERLITLGKKGSLGAKRLAFQKTCNRSSVVKLFGPLAERYTNRAGGYTRILRMSRTRLGDGAEMAMIEFVDRPQPAKEGVGKKTASKENAEKSLQKKIKSKSE